ncbi:MAG: hypothetical protein WHT47_06155 [Hydrogenothermaceae bacterium]
MKTIVDVIEERGLQKGLEQGLQQGIKESIIKLYTKKSFSPKEIAGILDLSVEYVKEVLKEKGYSE